MFGVRASNEAGGLMSYGSNIGYQNRQAAAFVDKVLSAVQAALRRSGPRHRPHSWATRAASSETHGWITGSTHEDHCLGSGPRAGGLRWRERGTTLDRRRYL